MRLQEVSGMVASRTHPGLLWAINDSGNSPSLFLIDGQGKIIREYVVEGMVNFDWEDIAIYTDTTSGTTSLFIADIGDNLAIRDFINVIELPEPQDLKDTLIRRFINHRFRFEDGARDAESLIVDPMTRVMYIISKREKNVRIYQAPSNTPSSDTLLLTYKQSLPYHNINAADITQNGREILIKNYDAIYYWKKNKGESLLDALARAPERLIYTPEPQGESIAWTIDNMGFYTLSERNQPKDQFLYYYHRNKEIEQ